MGAYATFSSLLVPVRHGAYPEIAANAAQWQAWQTLFALDDPQTPAQRTQLLKTHPSLVLDTRCFAPEFVDRLSAAFDNLDGWTDGLLVHSENWQALNLLGERYRERVQCIHIDPPYNTQSSGFLYKNSYQHSSWLSMMHDRIEASIGILEESGLWACHIDEYEIEKLQMLLDGLSLFDGGTLIWDKGMPNTGANGLATQHEYVLFRAQMATPKIRVQKKNITAINTKIQELVVAQGGPTKEAIAEYRKWLRSQRQLSKAERTYDQFDETGNAFRSDNMSATDKRTDPKFHVPLKHQITGQNCPVPEYGWRYTPDSMAKLLQSSTILFGDDHTSMPRKKTYLESTHDSQMPSMYKSGSRGKSDLDEYMLEFPFAHSVEFYTYLIDSLTRVRSIALDFFAGSGTTGHAVINLNREDGGRRKFILVEMGNYFDTVLLPRILKVTYTPEWKEGKPKRLPTAEEVERSPRLIKVLRLESYEDALNNIDFDDAAGQPALRFDDYLLQYMLRWETRHSETLLNVEKLDRPFAYTLHLHRDGETRTQPVDLPETFNYLLGLAVRTRQVLFDNVHSGRDARVPGNTGVSPALGNPGVRYLVYRGVLRDGRTVAVLWRDTAGWTEADYTRDRDFVAAQKLAEDVDDLFVNGDSFIPGAQALEGVFKARMFAKV